MPDHWWLIRAARISFLPSQPVSAAPLAGPLKPWLVGGGECRSIPTSASNPPTWKHTDVLIHWEI